MIQGSLTIGEAVEFGRRRLGFRVETGYGDVRKPLEVAAVHFFDDNESQQKGQEPESGLPLVVTGGGRAFLPSCHHYPRLVTLLEKGCIPLIVCARIRSDEYLSSFRSLAEANGTVLVTSSEDPWLIASRMTAYLKRRIEGFVSLQGGLVEVRGTGVLIRGESGSGKTSCAMELIRRGHRLVADDRVDVQAVGKGTLLAGSPTAIKNLMHIRGLGIVDVASLFGQAAVSDRAVVGLCCVVKGAGTNRPAASEAWCMSRLLNQYVPTVTVPFRNAIRAADRIEQAVDRLSIEGALDGPIGT